MSLNVSAFSIGDSSQNSNRASFRSGDGGVLVVRGSETMDSIIFNEVSDSILRMVATIGGESITKDHDLKSIGEIRVFGMGGDDEITINSSIKANVKGGDGNDMLMGGSGNDILSGDAGNDFIYGREGDDVLRGSSGEDMLLGGAGNDRAFGDADNDRISGNEGNDLLNGGAGDDFVLGGDGDDRLIGSVGDDDLRGNAGTDFMNGGSGDDFMNGGEGNDTLLGATGDDLMRGELGDDVLRGGSGNDVLRGEEGNDLLNGGGGDDALFGGDGNDRMNGASGYDALLGQAGDDDLTGGFLEDAMVGGGQTGDLHRTVFMVSHNGDLDDGIYGDGSLTFREAVRLSDDHDVIRFDKLTANGDVSIDLGASLEIQNQTLKIQGDDENLVTISGQSNSRHLSITESNVTISDVEFSKGLSSAGGSIDARDSSLTLQDVSFRYNTAENSGRGGAIFAYGSDLTINGGAFDGNRTESGSGGALALFESTATFDDVALTENVAYGSGGAIYSYGSELTISNSTLSGNESRVAVSNLGGGAISAAGASKVELHASTLSENWAAGGSGGAILNSGADVSVVGSTIHANVSEGAQGGGIYNAINGNLSVISSTISENEALDTSSGFGGGISSAGNTFTLINSTLSGNKGHFPAGGGAYILGNTRAQIINSTIAFNFGGGINVNRTTVMNNSLVFGNRVGSVSRDIGGTLDTVNSFNNLVGTADFAGGLVNGERGNRTGIADAGLDANLADNGGLTRTHNLMSGSLAIDAGSNSRARDEDGNPLTLDQRGQERIKNGIVDIGATEF